VCPQSIFHVRVNVGSMGIFITVETCYFRFQQLPRFSLPGPSLGGSCQNAFEEHSTFQQPSAFCTNRKWSCCQDSLILCYPKSLLPPQPQRPWVVSLCLGSSSCLSHLSPCADRAAPSWVHSPRSRAPAEQYFLLPRFLQPPLANPETIPLGTGVIYSQEYSWRMEGRESLTVWWLSSGQSL
jgi:hypothetical protein